MKIQSMLKNGIIAGIIAAVLNGIVFFLSQALSGIGDTVIIADGKPLTLMAVIISSLVPGILGSLFLFALSKFTKNPIKIFTIVSVVFISISMIGPITMPDLTIGMRITLVIMHLVAGAVIVKSLNKSETQK